MDFYSIFSLYREVVAQENYELRELNNMVSVFNNLTEFNINNF